MPCRAALCRPAGSERTWQPAGMPRLAWLPLPCCRDGRPHAAPGHMASSRQAGLGRQNRRPESALPTARSAAAAILGPEVLGQSAGALVLPQPGFYCSTVGKSTPGLPCFTGSHLPQPRGCPAWGRLRSPLLCLGMSCPKSLRFESAPCMRGGRGESGCGRRSGGSAARDAVARTRQPGCAPPPPAVLTGPFNARKKMVEICFKQESRGCSGSPQDSGRDGPHKPSLGGRFGAGVFPLRLQAPVRGRF